MRRFEENNQEVINSLNKLRDVAPDRSWSVQTRMQLRELAEHEALTKAKSPYVFSKLVAVPALAVLALFAFVGGGVVYASQGAEPDDSLYPLKLAIEKIQETIATTPEAKLELQQKFVQRRFDELDTLQQELTISGRNIDDVRKAIDRNKTAALALLDKIENATLVQFEGVIEEEVKEAVTEEVALETLEGAPSTEEATSTEDAVETEDTGLSETDAVVQEITEQITLADIKTAAILEKIDKQIKDHRAALKQVDTLTSELEQKQKQIIDAVLGQTEGESLEDELAENASTTTDVVEETEIASTTDAVVEEADTEPEEEVTQDETDEVPAEEEVPAEAQTTPLEIETETTTEATVDPEA